MFCLLSVLVAARARPGAGRQGQPDLDGLGFEEIEHAGEARLVLLFEVDAEVGPATSPCAGSSRATGRRSADANGLHPLGE
jgi:hypothetical protein